jgi:hypothetical protein
MDKRKRHYNVLIHWHDEGKVQCVRKDLRDEFIRIADKYNIINEVQGGYFMFDIFERYSNIMLAKKINVHETEIIHKHFLQYGDTFKETIEDLAGYFQDASSDDIYEDLNKLLIKYIQHPYYEEFKS